MPTINIPVSGRITPYERGFKVVVFSDSPSNKRDIPVNARGYFEAGVDYEVPLFIYRQLIRKGQLEGELKVLDAEGLELYVATKQTFKFVNNPPILIQLPISIPDVSVKVKLGGSVKQMFTGLPLKGYLVLFTTKIGELEIKLETTSSAAGGIQLTKQIVIPKKLLDQQVKFAVSVLYRGKIIKGVYPQEIEIIPGKPNNISLFVKAGKVDNLIIHFREDTSKQPFLDRVVAEFTIGRKVYLLETVTGEIRTEVNIQVPATVTKIHYYFTDAFGNKVIENNSDVVLGLNMVNEFTYDLWYPPVIVRNVSLLRPLDMLVLDFEFNDLKEDGDNLIPLYKGKDCLMIVTFPPQSFAEEAVFESDPKIPVNADDGDVGNVNTKKANIPASSRISGKSRLAFLVKSGEKIRFSENGLLKAMSELELNINWVASGTIIPPLMEIAPGKEIPDWLKRSDLRFKLLPGTITDLPNLQPLPLPGGQTWDKPAITETSIEAPFRLLISPHKGSQWLHDTSVKKPATTKFTELWHSRLVYRKNHENKTYNTIRAIWTLDPYFLPGNINRKEKDVNEAENEYGKAKHYPTDIPLGSNPFRMSLDAFDRENIVHLTSNRKLKTSPVNVENLMLSSLGAFLDVHGQWEPSGSLSVKEWQHRATLGRDQFVKVVYKGYLFPFGNQAALVKVTERKIINEVDDMIKQSAAGFAFLQVNITQADYIGLASQALIASGSGRGETKDKIRNRFYKQVSAFVEKRLKGQSSRLIGKIKKDLESRFGKLIEKITDVKSLSNPENSVTYLKQRMFIIVSEPEKIYNLKADWSKEWHKWPFRCTRFKTLITPNLDDPNQSSVEKNNSIGNYGQSLFWPKVNGQYFRFQMSVEDYNGNIIEFLAPLIFAENNEAKLSDAVNSALTSYSNESISYNTNSGIINKKAAIVETCSQPVLFAVKFDDIDKDKVDNPAKTTVKARSLTFSAFIEDVDQKYQVNDNPAFLPQIEEAEVYLPVIQALLGNNSTASIKYWGSSDNNSGYVINGFETNNVGEIYAEVINDLIIDYNAQGDKVGGLIKPNIKVTGLSRLLGPVGGELTDLASGIFKPEELFKGTDASIFGVIQLWDILQSPVNFLKNDLKKLPCLNTKDIAGGTEVSFIWEDVQLKNWKKIFVPEMECKNDAIIKTSNCYVESKIIKGTNKYARFYSKMNNLTICLLGETEYIKILFGSISFESINGENQKISVELEDIKFAGDLAFVASLLSYIPFLGFNDKPDYAISEKGIQIGFSLSIPNIAIGVFSLENISLGAAFTLPFIKEPMSLRFNFCERHRPFLLTYSLLGGSGFFCITLNTADVQMLEVAFEFGASLSLNFGVASGSVTVVVGIYYKMVMQPENSIELTGYLRINGKVSVMGIISVSITLLLELRYFPLTKVKGRATLTLEISILFFSINVEISYEKKFIGSANDPTFEDLMKPYEDVETGKMVEPWNEYWRAFAN